MNSKGQITIFLILAALLIVLLIVMFSLRGDDDDGIVITQHDSELDLQDVEDYIRQVMRVSVDTSLKKLQEEGYVLGQRPPNVNGVPIGISFDERTLAPEYLAYPQDGFRFPTLLKLPLGTVRMEKLCDIEGENGPDKTLDKGLTCERDLFDFPVATDTDLQTQIRDKLDQDLRQKITEQSLQDVVDADYTIAGDPGVEVQMAEDAITAIMKWKITGSREESSYTIKELTTTLKTDLPLMYTMLYKAMLAESESIDFNIARDYQTLPCLDFSTTDLCTRGFTLEKLSADGQYYPIRVADAGNEESLTALIENRNPIVEDFFSEYAVEGGSTSRPFMVFVEGPSMVNLPLNFTDPDEGPLSVDVRPVIIGDPCEDAGVFVAYDAPTKNVVIDLGLVDIKDDISDCETGDGTILPGCLADGELFGDLSDGTTDNELRCSYIVSVEDELGLKDETLLNFVVENA